MRDAVVSSTSVPVYAIVCKKRTATKDKSNDMRTNESARVSLIDMGAPHLRKNSTTIWAEPLRVMVFSCWIWTCMASCKRRMQRACLWQSPFRTLPDSFKSDVGG